MDMDRSVGPHWERGYRCHGYWLDLVRLGVVSIGPGRGAARRHGYRWCFGSKEGLARTLRAARRAIERVWQATFLTGSVCQSSICVL